MFSLGMGAIIVLVIGLKGCSMYGLGIVMGELNMFCKSLSLSPKSGNFFSEIRIYC